MANIMPYAPVTEMSRLQREVDRLFDRFFGNLTEEKEGALSQVWTPVVDISETDDAYLVRMDLPGLSRDDVTVTFENGTLMVSGERKQLREEKGEQFHRIERWQGRFFRSFQLGQNVDADKIKATFKDGVLMITVPKREESKPVRIKIS
ncbi:Hsp20/alpha crystallin family protein [Rhodocaloribacter litoris]|uniref:Hsp20/alpha crystallin family protein n=1 Tax=Rhodocaloribacter litoris TaxID=2558931 RepID=UPI00141ED566|nr:Hsp20/alpha crystallin family protein [Rhodocaloribacter litoris]QXD13765.1 Hsp20/alpha crystallin family protein [Rhodocaloribacter litoris]